VVVWGLVVGRIISEWWKGLMVGMKRGEHGSEDGR
jgi:hypothetical protein